MKNNGIETRVINGKFGNEAGTKENIKKALEDPNVKGIIFSGHGYSNGGIVTYDNDRLRPSDIQNYNISSELELIIFENCYQKGSSIGKPDNLEKWETVFGSNVNIVGWEDQTFVTETISFNKFGFFDRQENNLRYFLKTLVNNN